MANDPDVFATCDGCGKPIYYGNACVEIIRNIQQVDRSDEYPNGIRAGIDSTPLATFCAERGNEVVVRTEPEED